MRHLNGPQRCRSHGIGAQLASTASSAWIALQIWMCAIIEKLLDCLASLHITQLNAGCSELCILGEHRLRPRQSLDTAGGKARRQLPRTRSCGERATGPRRRGPGTCHEGPLGAGAAAHAGHFAGAAARVPIRIPEGQSAARSRHGRHVARPDARQFPGDLHRPLFPLLAVAVDLRLDHCHGHHAADRLSGGLCDRSHGRAVVDRSARSGGRVLVPDHRGQDPGRVLFWLGAVSEPVTIVGNVPGVILGLIYYTLGFAILLFYSIVVTVPRSLEEAAEVHGASRAGVFRQVVMPLCLPGIAAGALMIFNVNMGGFSSTALIGAGKILTLPIVIQRTVILESNYGLGAALAVLLLVVVLVINAFSVLLLLRARRGMIV